MGFNEKDYIPTSEVIKLLGLDIFKAQKASTIIGYLGIKRKIFSDGNTFIGYCERKSFDSVFKKLEEFYNEYCVVDEYDLPNDYIKKNLTSYPMPKGYNAIFYSKRLPGSDYKVYKVLYKKKDLNHLKETSVNNIAVTYLSDEELLASGDYLTLKETETFLNAGRTAFKEIRNHFDLGEIKIKGKTYLNKTKIEEFIKAREVFYKEYITAPDISLEYLNGNTNRAIIPKLKSYEAPTYFLTTSNSVSISCVGVFKRAEVEEYLKSINYGQIKISDITGDTPFDTFKERLNTLYDWKGYSDNSEFTYKEWFKYVEKALSKSKCNSSTMSCNINTYIQCTLLLKKLLDSSDKKEIYMFTSNELNLFQKGISVIQQRRYIYYFIRKVYQEIISEYGSSKVAYKISLIEKPPRKKNKKNNKENSDDIIYDFEVYSEVFQYQLKLDYHVKNSLNEIFETGTATYASTWLYVMLHLNNAWRNGDVTDFPDVDIDDLLISFEIDDLDWFKTNVLSLPKARGIISRIIQKEFIISKTKMNGHFFCSDDLAPALATAVIILTLYKKSQIIDDNEKLIMFNTKYNQVNRTLLNIFFKELKIDGFKFKSKKFNKTVMTYITYLANLSGDKKALKYAQYMRSQIAMSSLLHYIDFNIKSVEKLSSLLFARGEFGYITSLLLAKLNHGEVPDFEEATKQIYSINQMFGDVTKMSTTIGFLNTIRGERASVAKYLSEKGLKECQEILTDLFARKLPSKQGSDIQCLFSKMGCQKTELKSCFDCPYHIPTIYALTSLCEVLVCDLKRYCETKNIPNRYKLALSIHRKKLVLSEAVKKFGSEYVFNCLGIDKETFIDILSDIPNPLQVSNN